MDIGKTCIRSASAVALLGASLAVQAHTVVIGWDDLGNGGDVTFYAGTYHGHSAIPISGLNISSGPAGVGGPYLFTSRIPDSAAIPSILDGFEMWPLVSHSLMAPSLGGGSSSFDWQLVTVSGLISGSYSFSTTETSEIEFPWGPPLSGTIAVTSISQIPTPGTLALLSFALTGLGFSRRRTQACNAREATGDTNTKTPFRVTGMTLTALVALALAAPAFAVPINYAGRVFDSADFADTASGTYTGAFGNASNIADALTGFTPSTAIINAPSGTDIVLTFDDVRPTNGAGADIIIYESHSPSGYLIALRSLGGAFTSFVAFSPGQMISSGVTTNVGFGVTNVLELTLDITTFGLAPGTIVDALRFQAGVGDAGDMMMAAALNRAAATVPEPSPLSLLAGVLVWLGVRAQRRGRNPQAALEPHWRLIRMRRRR